MYEPTLNYLFILKHIMHIYILTITNTYIQQYYLGLYEV